MPNMPLKTLKQQPSKLDLIDDTTLTSLPFPPPPPAKRTSASAAAAAAAAASSSSLSSSSNGSVGATGDRRLCKLNTSRSRQLNTTGYNDQVESEYVGDLNFHTFGEANEVEEEEEDEDLYEYSYEEEDPIVLVEDYLSIREESPSYTTFASTSTSTSTSMKPSERTTTSTRSPSPDHHLLRQQSLANFKKRVLSTSSNNSTDTIILQPEERVDRKTDYQRSTSATNSPASQLQPQPQPHPQRQHSDDLQAIFGDLPSFHLLKHCDLCDKPLYEISSIINAKSNLDLKEFVCGDCISNYEVFMAEFVQEQQQQQKKKRVDNDAILEPASKKMKNTKFWHVLNHISSKYNIRREVV